MIPREVQGRPNPRTILPPWISRRYSVKSGSCRVIGRLGEAAQERACRRLELRPVAPQRVHDSLELQPRDLERVRPGRVGLVDHPAPRRARHEALASGAPGPRTGRSGPSGRRRRRRAGGRRSARPPPRPRARRASAPEAARRGGPSLPASWEGATPSRRERAGTACRDAVVAAPLGKNKMLLRRRARRLRDGQAPVDLGRANELWWRRRESFFQAGLSPLKLREMLKRQKRRTIQEPL